VGGIKTSKIGQKQAKLGKTRRKPKKYVEKPRFSIDFAYPQAAL
jgi:hypothetical protein